MSTCLTLLRSSKFSQDRIWHLFHLDYLDIWFNFSVRSEYRWRTHVATTSYSLIRLLRTLICYILLLWCPESRVGTALLHSSLVLNVHARHVSNVCRCQESKVQNSEEYSIQNIVKCHFYLYINNTMTITQSSASKSPKILRGQTDGTFTMWPLSEVHQIRDNGVVLVRNRNETEVISKVLLFHHNAKPQRGMAVN